jgi:hypothetical protein
MAIAGTGSAVSTTFFAAPKSEIIPARKGAKPYGGKRGLLDAAPLVLTVRRFEMFYVPAAFSSDPLDTAQAVSGLSMTTGRRRDAPYVLVRIDNSWRRMI